MIHLFRIRTTAAALLSLSGWAWAPAAHAHGLLMSCEPVASHSVRCTGRFSDGSDAAGLRLRVLLHDDQVVLTTTLDTQSSALFVRPETPFYVALDDGGEHAVEVDHEEIR